MAQHNEAHRSSVELFFDTIEGNTTIKCKDCESEVSNKVVQQRTCRVKCPSVHKINTVQKRPLDIEDSNKFFNT